MTQCNSVLEKIKRRYFNENIDLIRDEIVSAQDNRTYKINYIDIDPDMLYELPVINENERSAQEEYFNAIT